MQHQIKKVVTVRGKRLEYLCVLYLENGCQPKVICRVRFPKDSTILSQTECSNIEDLEALIDTYSRVISESFGYRMNSVSVPKGVYADRFIRHVKDCTRLDGAGAPNAFLN